MIPTGRSVDPILIALERRRAEAAARIAAQMQQAWVSYRWVPLHRRSHRVAWSRLREFTAHLLCHTHEFMQRSDVTQTAITAALSRWLHTAKLTPEDAVAWLLETDREPDPLFERLADAATVELTGELTNGLMAQMYSLRPFNLRRDLVHTLRRQHPVVDAALGSLPDWTLVDDLPTVHNLCVEECTTPSQYHSRVEPPDRESNEPRHTT